MELSENSEQKRSQSLRPADAFIQVDFSFSHLTHSLFVQLGIYCCSLNVALRAITAVYAAATKSQTWCHIEKKQEVVI